jgi:hypothetical protein
MMRWRLIVLGSLAVALAIGCVLCTKTAIDLQFRAQHVFTGDQQSAPTIEQQSESDRLYFQSYGLQLVIAPLASASLASGLAVPAVLGRRWQVREAAKSAGRLAAG